MEWYYEDKDLRFKLIFYIFSLKINSKKQSLKIFCLWAVQQCSQRPQECDSHEGVL